MEVPLVWPFLHALLYVETVVEPPPPRTQLCGKTQRHVLPEEDQCALLPVQTFCPSVVQGLNCLKSLFMYSRLGKLGYVSRKSFPVSDLKSEQRCSWWALRRCQCILSTFIFQKEHELSVLNLSLLGLLCTHVVQEILTFYSPL